MLTDMPHQEEGAKKSDLKGFGDEGWVGYSDTDESQQGGQSREPTHDVD